MILKTKIAVTHSDQEKKLTGGTKDSIVTMVIPYFSYTAKGIEIPFEYTDADEFVLPTDHDGTFKVPAEDVKALSQSVNATLPATDNIEDRMWSEIKAIATNEMIASFGITADDIEEVN